MATVEPAAYEGRVVVLHRLPVRQLSREGQLRVDRGRVQLVAKGGRSVLDAPLDQLHSWAPLLAEDFHLWHGSTRYRLCALGPVLPVRRGAADHPGVAPLGRSGRDQWGELLRPLIAASPPSGVRVRPPWPAWAWWLAMAAITVAVATIVYLLLP